jgi:hypothetical protein
MSEQELFEKNLVLTTEFDRYLLEHPEIAEQIPLNAQIVLLPDDDPELSQKNREIAAAQREPSQPVVYVHIQQLAPAISRLVNPQITVEAA